MKLKTLSALIAMAGISSVLPAHAVYNLYNKDGLTLDVHGEMNVYGKNERKQYSLQYSGSDTPWYLASGGMTQMQGYYKGFYEERADRRTRLAQDAGASWIEFRGAQEMEDGWRVSGTIGTGYADTVTGLYLNTANLTVDKEDKGALSIGRQYLHTGYVTRTGTYTPLETFGASSLRLDYTGIDKLHLSGYYNLPSSADVHSENNLETEGFGASASYVLPFNDQALRFAAGYTNSKRNPNRATRDGNNIPMNAQGIAGSIEYRHKDFLVAADIGYKKEDLDGSNVDKASSNFYGVKLGYNFTPKFNMVAGYGVQDVSREYKEGSKPLIAAVPVFSSSHPAGSIAARREIDRLRKQFLQLTTTGDEKTATNIIDAYSSFLFDDSEQKRAYVQANYYLRDNVRLYARLDQEEVQNKLYGEDYAKFKDTTYRAGVSLTF